MTSAVITQRSIIGWFFERLRTAPMAAIVDAICTPILRSDQDSEDYAWLGMVPGMREKKGEKQFSQLRDVAWAIKNIEYQNGLSIPEKHILYDKTGQVQIRVNEFADTVTEHWWELAAQLLLAAEASVCYDGKYFFDTTHSEGSSGQQSNDITFKVGTPTKPTETEMIDAILEGIEQMISFKDDRGRYTNRGMREFLILTGPKFLKSGLKALSQTRIGGGNTNILLEQDSFQLSIFASPEFSTWTDKFAIISKEGTQKPIIRQQRVPNNAGAGYDAQGIRMQQLWLDSEHCIKNGEVLVTVDTERAAAYGDWKKACLVTLTST